MIGELKLIYIFVSDMERSAAFYRDVFGLKAVYASKDWTQFNAGGVDLALHLKSPENPVKPDGSCIFSF